MVIILESRPESSVSEAPCLDHDPAEPTHLGARQGTRLARRSASRSPTTRLDLIEQTSTLGNAAPPSAPRNYVACQPANEQE